MKEDLIQRLKKELPPIWNRKLTTKLTGGAVNSGTLKNLMNEGKGPEGTFKQGRNVIIDRDKFLKWFESRMKMI